MSAVLAATVLVPGLLSAPSLSALADDDPSFVFGAAGTLGSSVNAWRTLDRLALGATDFFLALGDLSLNKSESERNWADLVKSRLGVDYPFEVLSGDNEDNGPNGLIDNFAKFLPDLMNATGVYGKEYYFDYPSAKPLARFILISPRLSFTFGGGYTYTVANSHFIWLSNAIDSARSAGIPWLIVGMHMGCLSTGTTGCDIGQDLVDLLTAKRVDLVLQGHDATYQRSRQLACGVRGYFISECVADLGPDGNGTKDLGPVFVVAGIGGARVGTVNPLDAERSYFTSGLMGSKTNGWGYGYVRFTVSPDRIEARTEFNGTWSDAFEIRKPPPSALAASLSFYPAQPLVAERASFSALVSGGTPPYNATWAFGDDTNALGTSTSHVYASPGNFSLSLNVTDALGDRVSIISRVAVTSSLGPPAFRFAAAGDIGSTADSNRTLTRLGSSAADFFLALGDLSANGTGSESNWSQFVKARVGDGYPFELLSGNHEDTGTRDGLIDNFATFLPDRMNATGVYGKEYYFDVPQSSPLARFILISPGLTFSGKTWTYTAGDLHYAWLSKAIDGARARGIRWVVVGMHKPCLSVSGGCEAGQDVLDLLAFKHVDFVLSGHHHSYQRGKAVTCALRNYYLPFCVGDDGAASLYPAGAGTIFQVEGTAGQGKSGISLTDGDVRYFTAKLMGSNTPGRGYGFLTYDVWPGRIHVRTDFSGTFADEFIVTEVSVITGTTVVAQCEPVPAVLDILATRSLADLIVSLPMAEGRNEGVDSGTTLLVARDSDPFVAAAVPEFAQVSSWRSALPA